MYYDSRKAGLLVAACLATALAGCQTIFQGIYGIRGLRPADGTELRITATRYGIPATEVAVLDTSYRALLGRMHQRDSLAAKDHYQPLQVLYYTATGYLQVFYVNCYAGGFPNLDWQAQGAFKQFPPAPQARIDTLLPLATYLSYLRTPEGSPLRPSPTADYTIVVQWSRFMGRQTRRLIEVVQRNAALARQQGHSVRLLFVSNDSFTAYLLERQNRR